MNLSLHHTTNNLLFSEIILLFISIFLFTIIIIRVASKLHRVNATIILLLLYCIVFHVSFFYNLFNFIIMYFFLLYLIDALSSAYLRIDGLRS